MYPRRRSQRLRNQQRAAFRSLYGDVLQHVFEYVDVINVCTHARTSKHVRQAGRTALAKRTTSRVVSRNPAKRHAFARNIPQLCPNLEYLEFLCGPQDNDQVFLLANLPKLKMTPDFIHCSSFVGDDIPSLPNMRDFEGYADNHGQQALDAVAAKCRNLTSLTLQRLAKCRSLARLLAANPRLQRVEITPSDDMLSIGEDTFVALRRLPDLRYLWLCNVTFERAGDGPFRQLADAAPNLTTLKIATRSGGITVTGLHYMSTVMRHLEELVIMITGPDIATSWRAPWPTVINDELAELFERESSFPNLRYLSIQAAGIDGDDMPEDVRERIQRARPGCTVSGNVFYDFG